MRHHPYKLYGVVLLAVIAAAVTFSVLLFNEAFTSVDHVTVHVKQAGLQLLPGSDVKVRGIIVGSVKRITSTGQGADLELALNPAKARTIPRNVTVRMLPKTRYSFRPRRVTPQKASRWKQSCSCVTKWQTWPGLWSRE